MKDAIQRAHGERTIALSPLLVRLAARLEVPPNVLALQIDPDTIRRTKYPVVEEVTEDGKIIFHRANFVIDGPAHR